MAIGRNFLQRNTGLGTSGSSHWPLPTDLVWFPWLGLLCGLLTAGFFLPLALIALPVDVALVLAMLWQMTMIGFRSESAIFSSSSQPSRVAARQIALLLVLLLIKVFVLRQFFVEEIGRLWIYSGIMTFCVPVMAAPSVETTEATAPPRLPLPVILQAFIIWAAATFWVCNPNPWAELLSPAAYRPVIVILLAGTFCWLLMMDGKRRFGTADGPWGNEIFAGALAAECGALTALLATRHIFL